MLLELGAEQLPNDEILLEQGGAVCNSELKAVFKYRR
jgi:hypothetical protein